MSAFVYVRKYLLWGMLGALSLLFTFGSIGYANALSRAKTVATEECFYYLVDTSNNTQAVSNFVDLQGGAGYFLQQDNREYVAYAMYMNKTEGEKAKVVLSAQNQNVALVPVYVNNLVFKTKTQKSRSQLVVRALSWLRGSMQILQQEIQRLDRGATQQSSRHVITTLVKQFAYMEKEYRASYSDFSLVCKTAGEQLTVCINDIIFSKDLRYVLCYLGVEYQKLGNTFSL